MVIILKENGNIRTIDSLGRIVIPRDMRKRLHISDNDTLKIYTEGQTIKIEKYSTLSDFINYLNALLDIANRITENIYIIADKTNVLASSVKSIINAPLSNDLKEYINNKNVGFNDVIIGEKKYSKTQCNIFPLNIDSINQGLIMEICTSGERNNKVISLLKGIIEKKINTY